MAAFALLMSASVAWRGEKGSRRAVSSRAMRAAQGPLMRTTPRPPRPGGVATATMVSLVLNIGRPLSPSRGNDHRLQEGVADALRRHLRILRDGEVHEPPCVWIERAHFLR